MKAADADDRNASIDACVSEQLDASPAGLPGSAKVRPLRAVVGDSDRSGRGKRSAAEEQSRICRTAEDAFWAGYNAECEHGVPDPNDCRSCQLTDAEIGQIAVLHRPYLEQSPRIPAAA
ncbi:hypothetical protein [Streptomyces erythrochromogenes]|uniref:hypothetical protein n=1 Tax=Streptomyces erythrochromogenes TaxID=285574 RepID=UPI0034047E7C